jgi:hypothetical protein
MPFVPDFILVGAPKCGTTSLFSYLADHDGIAASRVKEPFFWCPDIAQRERVAEPRAYRALWDGAAPGALTGEASADYAMSAVAIPTIAAARADVKLIMIVRNPAEMAASYHSEMVQSFQEPEMDFGRAWRLQAARASGRGPFSRDTIEPRKLQYLRACALGDQLERVFAHTTPENRLAIVFDDLARDPRAVYARTLAFLGLADDGRSHFPRINRNRNLRSVRLAATHRSVPRLLGPLYGPARALARSVGFSPSAIVNRFNIREGERRAIDAGFAAELRDAFTPQVEKIERLLARDLSHWKRVPAPGASARGL